ncbi:MAG TPA: MarR family transcriptional regulator [bacterium]|nr:MarR family transcriptional regulator [bacterium]
MHQKLLLHLLLHSGKLLEERIKRALRPYGIHQGQARILNALNCYGERSQIEIARGLHIERATATIMLQKLETAGLIKRTAHDRDGRVIVVSLTPKGKKAAEKVDAVWQEIEEKLLATLGDLPRDTMEDALLTIRNAFGGKSPAFKITKEEGQ